MNLELPSDLLVTLKENCALFDVPLDAQQVLLSLLARTYVRGISNGIDYATELVKNMRQP